MGTGSKLGFFLPVAKTVERKFRHTVDSISNTAQNPSASTRHCIEGLIICIREPARQDKTKSKQRASWSKELLAILLRKTKVSRPRTLQIIECLRQLTSQMSGRAYLCFERTSHQRANVFALSQAFITNGLRIKQRTKV